jgi:hypothetical protein
VRSTIPAVIGSTLQAATALYVADPSDGHNNSAPTVSLLQGAADAQFGSIADWAGSVFSDAEASPAPRFQNFVEWNSATAKRFNLLAEKEALGTAAPPELDELEMLSLVRRRKVAPRSGAEILHEFEERELIRDLLRSLNRYVQFENRTSSPAPRASRQRSEG